MSINDIWTPGTLSFPVGRSVPGTPTMPRLSMSPGITTSTVIETSGAAVIANAISFNGVDEYVRGATGSPIGNAIGSNDVSFGCWFNSPGLSSNGVLMSNGSNSSGGIMSKMDGSGNLYIYVFTNSTTNEREQYTATLDDGSWHHFVAVWDNTANAFSAVYVDGVSVSTTTTGSSTGPGDEDNRFTIGARMGTTSAQEFFNGEITGVFAMTHKMTSGEVSEMYGGGTSGAIRPKEHSQSANLVYAYDGMEDGDDLTASTGQLSDSSGNGGETLTPVNTVVGDLVAFP